MVGEAALFKRPQTLSRLHVRALGEDLAHALVSQEPDNSSPKSLMTLKSLKTELVLPIFFAVFFSSTF